QIEGLARERDWMREMFDATLARLTATHNALLEEVSGIKPAVEATADSYTRVLRELGVETQAEDAGEGEVTAPSAREAGAARTGGPVDAQDTFAPRAEKGEVTGAAGASDADGPTAVGARNAHSLTSLPPGQDSARLRSRADVTKRRRHVNGTDRISALHSAAS